jgi:ribosomal 30S subunit maturation factor RimM
MSEKYISVGKILNFHGIKGEAKVGFTQSQADFILS